MTMLKTSSLAAHKSFEWFKLSVISFPIKLCMQDRVDIDECSPLYTNTGHFVTFLKSRLSFTPNFLPISIPPRRGIT